MLIPNRSTQQLPRPTSPPFLSHALANDSPPLIARFPDHVNVQQPARRPFPRRVSVPCASLTFRKSVRLISLLQMPPIPDAFQFPFPIERASPLPAPLETFDSELAPSRQILTLPDMRRAPVPESPL